MSCLFGLAGAALGQGQIAYEVDHGDYDDPATKLSTAPGVAVNALAAVVVGTHKIVLFDKSAVE